MFKVKLISIFFFFWSMGFGQFTPQFRVLGDFSYSDVVFADSNTVMLTGSNLHITSVDGERSWYGYSLGGMFVKSAFFSSVDFGIAVGNSGKYRINTQCGYSLGWTQKNTGTGKDFLDVYFRNDDEGYVCGEEGTLLKTMDQTENWTTINTNTLDDLNGIWSRNESEMIVCTSGGAILKVDDTGGVSSQIIDPAISWNKIHFVDEQVGFVVGTGGNMYKTIDGGNNWFSLVVETTEDLLSLVFTSATHGVITATEGEVFVTEDAGETWTATITGIDDDIRSVAFKNDLEGYAVTQTAALQTVDGGHTWILLTGDLRKLNFPTKEVGYAIGWDGVAFKTIDKGETWIPLELGVPNYLNDVHFLNRDTGFVVGSGDVFKTEDGGETWISLDNPNDNSLYGVHFTDVNHGVAVGTRRSILYTDDGGQTWDYSNSFSSTISYLDVHFTSDLIGYFVATNGRIYKTVNRGEDWTLLSSNTASYLSRLFFLNDDLGWALGSNGTLLKTTDGGENWMTQETGTSESLSAAFFFNENEGVIVGQNGTYLLTYNGGDSWANHSNGSTDYTDVVFTDKDHGYTTSRRLISVIGAFSNRQFTGPYCQGEKVLFFSFAPYFNNDDSLSVNFEIVGVDQSFDEAIILSNVVMDSLGRIEYSVPEDLPEGIYKTRIVDVNEPERTSFIRHMKVVTTPIVSFVLEDSILIASATHRVKFDWLFSSQNGTVIAGFGDSLVVNEPGQYTLRTQTLCCGEQLLPIYVDWCSGAWTLNLYQNEQTICSGDSLMIGENLYFESGVYLDTLVTVGGCDSIVETQLILTEAPFLSQDISICEGDQFLVGDQIYEMEGTYLDTLLAQNGCDSLVETNLSLLPKSALMVNEQICEGDTYFYEGMEYNQTGIYTFDYMNYLGCDSLVTLDLLVTPLPIVDLGMNMTLCAGDTMLLDGGIAVTYNWNTGSTDAMIEAMETGVYSVSILDENNCMGMDSVLLTFEICSSIADVENEFGLKIFPNPSSGKFYVESQNSGMNLEVFNASGQLVKQWKMKTNIEEVRLKKSGIYFLIAKNVHGEERVIKCVIVL